MCLDLRSMMAAVRRSFVRWLYSFGRHQPMGTPQELGLKSQDVSFPSRGDAVVLRGWFLPAENSDRAIILLHGGFMNRADPWVKALPLAADLVKSGFNVLTFDQRGSGQSDGDRFGLGYWEWRDALGALDYMKTRGFRSQKIGVIGFSTGAVIAIIAAARDPEVHAIVSDSAFADLRELLDYTLVRLTHLPKQVFAPVLHGLELLTEVNIAEVKPEAAVGRIKPRRILFIHGQKDNIVPPGHPTRLCAAANNPEDDLWIAPNAGHVQAYIVQPQEFLSRVVTFFSNALC